VTLILITEWNMVSAEYMANALREAGYETRATDSQTDALAIYQERRPDLVLTNFYLAEGSGLAFLKALRKTDPGSLVVVVTGLGSEAIARDVMQAGAFDYVVKSLSFYRDLPSMAEGFLRRSQGWELERRKEEARVRLAGQVELAGWLDHNFKNILSATMGSLALIDFADPEQPEGKRREFLSDGLDSVRSAVRLLDRLSQMGAGGSGAEAGRVIVAQAVDSAWEQVRESVSKAPPGEYKALHALLPRVCFLNEARALPPQDVVYDDLLTIFHALIMNALEALTQSSGNPTISVSARREGPFLVAEVRDNGRGMDHRTLLHAFEPLFSTKGEVGVGVSLAIVRSLVIKHKGEVGAVSTPREGSTFRFTYFVGEGGPGG
jgi:signal transduction histidine kinase